MFPDRRAWPIQDEAQALIAIRYIQMGRAKPSELKKIKSEIAKRFPSLKSKAMAAQPPKNEGLGECQVARLYYLLDEAPPATGQNPEFLKRCVFAIASKDPTPKTLNKAFAVCISQYQKKGYLAKGKGSKAAVTSKGTEYDKQKKGEKSKSGFSVSKYEKLLAMVRRQRNESVDPPTGSMSTVVQIYTELHEELIGEMQMNAGKFDAAIRELKTTVSALERAAAEKSLTALPGFMAQLVTYSLGRAGLMGAMQLTGLLSAVDAENPATLGKNFQRMLDSFRTADGASVDWAKVSTKVKVLKRLVTDIEKSKKSDGMPNPDAVVSLLGDVYLVLGQLAKIFSDGVADRQAKKAATVVQYDMRGDGAVFHDPIHGVSRRRLIG